jgi:NitT/TauT family transport system substrate-binding protein
MRRLSLLRLAAVSLTGLFVSAAAAQDKVTFLIDWLPAGDKAVPYLGVKGGFFAAENLDVTVQSARGSSEVVTRLATGVADLGTGGISSLFQARASGAVPVKALLPIYTQQPDAIFTTKGSGIEGLKDVVGKKVATASASSSNVTWPLVLQQNKIDAAAVSLLRVDPGALAPMLASGQVAATINWTTVAPGFEKTLKEAGKELVVIPWSKYGYDGYGLSLFASEKMLKERPEVVRRFVRAYQKATEAALANPKAAAEALKAMVPEVDVAVAVAQFEASRSLMVNPVTQKDGFGRFEPARVAKTWEWVSRSMNLPLDKIDPAAAVDTSFVVR